MVKSKIAVASVLVEKLWVASIIYEKFQKSRKLYNQIEEVTIHQKSSNNHSCALNNLLYHNQF